MKVLIIDNYDSFTYNLYQYVGEILSSAQSHGKMKDFIIEVKRNNEITLEQVKEFNPQRIIISPGPGTPEDTEYFGVCADVIKELGKKIPLLGVCLGMQGIVYAFGGKIITAPLPMHGKTSELNHRGENLFARIPQKLEIMRYHSLIAEARSFPSCLKLTAAVGSYLPENPNDPGIVENCPGFEIMGVEHKEYPIYGIQFHPESFATEGGEEILTNFLFNPLK